MSQDFKNQHLSPFVHHLGYQPVLVTPDVEYCRPISREIHRPEIRLYLVRAFVFLRTDEGFPCSKRSRCRWVSLCKQPQSRLGDNVHRLVCSQPGNKRDACQPALLLCRPPPDPLPAVGAQTCRSVPAGVRRWNDEDRQRYGLAKSAGWLDIRLHRYAALRIKYARETIRAAPGRAYFPARYSASQPNTRIQRSR